MADREARGSVRELSVRRRSRTPEIFSLIDWMASIVLLSLDLHSMW